MYPYIAKNGLLFSDFLSRQLSLKLLQKMSTDPSSVISVCAGPTSTTFHITDALSLTNEVKGGKQDLEACFLMTAKDNPLYPFHFERTFSVHIVSQRQNVKSLMNTSFNPLKPFIQAGIYAHRKSRELFHYCLHCVCKQIALCSRPSLLTNKARYAFAKGYIIYFTKKFPI